MNARLVSAVLLTFAVGLADRAVAQGGKEPRHGFWIGFGAGYSNATSSCDGCGSTTGTGGIAGQLRMGVTLKHNLLVGVDLESWNKSEGGKWARVANLTGAAYYYPAASAGLYLKGGVGLSSMSGTLSGYSIDGAGLGFTVGLGWDIPVTKGLYLTPTASFLWGEVGDIKSGSTLLATGWKQQALNVALDLTLP